MRVGIAGLAGLALLLACTLAARNNEPKKPGESRGEMNLCRHRHRLHRTRGHQQLLGSDLGGHYIVVALEVAPRFGKEVLVSHDDLC